VPAAQQRYNRAPALSTPGKPKPTAGSCPDAELPRGMLLAGIPIGACLGGFSAGRTPGPLRRATRQRRDAVEWTGALAWALTDGQCGAPRRASTLDCGFGYIRTLLDELNTRLSTCGTCAGYLRQVWGGCGHRCVLGGKSLVATVET